MLGIGFFMEQVSHLRFCFVFVSARICLYILLRGKETLQVMGVVDLSNIFLVCFVFVSF